MLHQDSNMASQSYPAHLAEEESLILKLQDDEDDDLDEDDDELDDDDDEEFEDDEEDLEDEDEEDE